MAVIMQERGGTAAEWVTADPVLAAREVGWETDTLRSKVGDGVTAWTALPYVNVPPTFGTVAPTSTPVVRGQIYVDTDAPAFYYAAGVTDANDWTQVVGGGGGGDLLAANNLSDLADAPTARTNLGVPSDAEVAAAIDADVATHEADTTGVHGITDTADLVTESQASIAGATWASNDGTMAGNSAQEVPTEQAVVTYVAAQIAALIASAPGALDTLDELAAALGDDANFAANTTAALAAKAAITDVVLQTLYDANTIVAADADNTPTARAIAEDRLVGRLSGGNIGALTGAEVTALLSTFTDVLQGLVPASAGGTSNYLRADGTWATPPGGSGGGVGPIVPINHPTNPQWDYWIPGFHAYVDTNFGTVGDTLYFTPMTMRRPFRLTELRCALNTGLVSTIGRIGFATRNDDNTVGAIHMEGTFDAAAAGAKVVAGSAVDLDPGRYWGLLVTEGGNTIRGAQGIVADGDLGTNLSSGGTMTVLYARRDVVGTAVFAGRTLDYDAVETNDGLARAYMSIKTEAQP